MTEEAKIFKFENPSTFTHIGRNDRAVNWVLEYRQEHNMPIIKKVGIIGSGVIEPFTLAALEGLSSAQVYALEINSELVNLGERIKKGDTVPWSNVASASHNPGRENNDLMNPNRLRGGLDRLKALGSLDKLGKGFNLNTIKVAKSVSDRITFINEDALHAISNQTDFDLIIDCFARVNINKIPNFGIEYTNQLSVTALKSLSENGMYLIGDTGESLPSTLDSFTKTSSGDVNWSSMVHIVQREPGKFTSSHYSIVSLMEDLNTKELQDQARRHIALYSRDIYKNHTETIDSLSNVPSQLTTSGQINLAYVEVSKRRGLVLNIPNKDLFKLAPDKGSEFCPHLGENGSGIIFPPQK